MLTKLAFISCCALLAGIRVADGQAAEPTEIHQPAASLQWQWVYDDHGQMVELLGPGGRETKIHSERDKDNRLKQLTKTLPDGTRVTFDYDAFQRPARMTDAAGKVRYEYDGFNRLTAVRRDGVPALLYGYDTLDRITSVSLGNPLAVHYVYDFLGRLARLETPAGAIAYEYQSGQGRIVRTLPNGIRTVWDYRPDGKLATLAHVAADNHILAQFSYDYRSDGLIQVIQESSPQGERTLSYDYDTVQRLTAVTDSQGGKTEYRYDKLGNRIEWLRSGQPPVTSAYDWAGRLTQLQGQLCAHDAAGNLTGCAGDPRNRTFAYDGENLLKQATTDGGTIQYQYDGDGNLVARTAGQEKTLFVPDPRAEIWRPLVAIQPDGTQTFFIWEGDMPLAAITGNESLFFLQDHLGSVRYLTDQSGNVTQAFTYSPFGVPQQNTAVTRLQPGFTGLFFDPKASLYLTRARGYEPEWGRLLQRDTKRRILLSSQEDFSAYVYAANNPINRIDITGQQMIPPPYFSLNQERGFFNYVPSSWACGLTGLCRLTFPTFLPGYWVPSTIPTITLPSPSNWQWDTNNLNVEYNFNKPASIDSLSFGFQYQPVSFLPHVTVNYSPIDHFQQNQPFQLGIGYGISDILTPPRSIPSLPSLPSFNINAPTLKNTFIGSVVESFNQNNLVWQNLAPIVKYSAISIYNSTFSNPPTPSMSPSNVGGIYLRGAAEALNHLGTLSGIALDDNNHRLILLSAENGPIDLPPLRLDDVVTIFRSVYEQGDAPFVSIDPDPRNPRGKSMVVRQGEKTQDTYVGWVLFEADRVMKAYSLGQDNVTRATVKSTVLGYRNLMDPAFAGSGSRQQNWERFWIVPASVKRLQANDRQLTLFDIPLKVNTQQMQLRQGKLIPAAQPKPSAGAEAFSRWFTEHYDDLGREAQSLPPPESGITSPVPIYTELRRIALISAVAEKLREQGVPFPLWMRGQTVQRVPVTPTTPAIVVKSSEKTPKGTLLRQIYGGVSLSPQTRDVAEVPDARAQALQTDVLKAMAPAPLLEPVSFQHEGEPYQAIALPGNDSREVGGNSLSETDLAVPLPGGGQLTLTRRFHSFFQPADVLGGCWTLDLPRLDAQRLPVDRTGDTTRYGQAYQLGSPLQTWSARFSRKERVPELEQELLVPDRPGEILALAGDRDQRIGQQTQMVLFRDGRRWHFDEAGRLVALQQAPLLVVYRWDRQGRVQRIEGWHGKELRADIVLAYDGQGRLISAKGSNGEKVAYTYDPAGAGLQVQRPAGRVRYTYAKGLVTAIERDGQPVARFTYNDRGQLQGTWQADGAELTYTTRSTPQGITVTATAAGAAGAGETVRYDAAFRPVSRVLADGTRIDWQAAEGGLVQATVTPPTGEPTVIVQTADGKPIRWQEPAGGAYAAEYDGAGRLTTLREGDRPRVQQQWRPDGQLGLAAYETVTLHPHYQDDGRLSQMLVTPPGEGTSFDRWLQVDYDELGRTAAMKDYAGAQFQWGYDATGQLAALVSQRDGQNQGFQIARNPQGQVSSVVTSWGYRQNNTYGKKGELQRIELTEGRDQAVIELEQGRPSKVRQFDGGQWAVSYDDQGKPEGQVKAMRTPNGLDLNYAYDQAGRPASVAVGDHYRVEYGYDGQGRLAMIRQMPGQQ